MTYSHLKTTVLTPEMLGFLEGGGSSNTVTTPPDGYAKVPLIFRSTRIRCNALLKLPLYLYRDDETTEADYPFEFPLRKLLWNTRAAGLLTGAGYVLKRSNRVMVKEVDWLNPTTMQVRWDAATSQRIFDQYIMGQHYGPWAEEELVYIREFTLRDDIAPGDCPASVALQDARLSHYLTRFAASFFEKGAMPVTLLTSEDGFGTQTEEVQNFYRRAMQGLKNAWRVLAVRARGVQFHTPQNPLKDLATPELREQARKDVALAFEIPVTLLDDDANYATAKEHKRGFYDETVIPDAEVFAEEFNTQLFHPLGLHLAFKPNEMDLYQDDERESAQAASTFAAMLQGMPDFETFQFVATTYGIEYDEQLAKQVFAAKEQRAAERREQFVNNPIPNPVMTAPEEPELHSDEGRTEEEDEEVGSAALTMQGKALGADLAKWEKRALKRIRQGGDLSFHSDTDAIPPSLAASILGALEAASNGDDVRGIFTNARTWGSYP
jgi:HK97 family phage portal protein